MDSKKVLEAYMKSFSANLKKIRQQKFDQVSDMSKHSAYDKSNYSKYEYGVGNPTLETILKIASALDVNPKDLFDFEFDISKHKIED